MQKDKKDEQETKEALAILLRVLSKPSSIKSEEEYRKLTYQAKKMLEEGYITTEKMIDLLNKSQLIH